jgi:Immunity protein 7
VNMYEAHGWMGLAETPHDIDNGGLESGLEELRHRVGEVSWPALTITLERKMAFGF